MKIAYRYEDDKGYGPYTSVNNFIPKFMKNQNIHVDDKHPLLINDCYIRDDIHLAACPTIKDLKTWFKGYNPKLIRNGFNLVKITVKDIGYSLGKSGFQCRINKKRITKKEILNQNGKRRNKCKS